MSRRLWPPRADLSHNRGSVYVFFCCSLAPARHTQHPPRSHHTPTTSHPPRAHAHAREKSARIAHEGGREVTVTRADCAIYAQDQSQPASCMSSRAGAPSAEHAQTCSRFAATATQMTPAGLEPAIPGSVGRCLIHWATGPIKHLRQRPLRYHAHPYTETWCPQEHPLRDSNPQSSD